MVANIFKVNGLYVHVGYDAYSNIAKNCMAQENFSLSDMYMSTVTSLHFYPSNIKRLKKKIYKTVCKELKNIADKDYNSFISQYYNHSYYGKQAQENISDFLNGVASVYPHLFFISDKKRYVKFPYGKKFSICIKKHRKTYIEIIIDTDDISHFWGSVDCFYIHFKSGFTIYFNYGKLKMYGEVGK